MSQVIGEWIATAGLKGPHSSVSWNLVKLTYFATSTESIVKKNMRDIIRNLAYFDSHMCLSKYATLPITLTADARSLQNLSP